MQPLPITVNGYDTYYVEAKDDRGPYLLIAIPPNAGKDMTNFCATMVCGHFIKQIDYKVIDGVRFIKAYY